MCFDKRTVYRLQQAKKLDEQFFNEELKIKN